MAAKKPSLTDRLLARSTLTEFTSRMDKSEVHTKSELIATPIPIMNIGLSGDFTKGIGSGLGQLAGPSRHFKTLFGLIMVGAYLRHHKDGICLFYDSEFGAGASYFESLGIDTKRVIHTPITNIEELKQDIVQQLEEIRRKDHVIIFVDSVGNLASKKEVDDAKSGNTAADMTRAKQMKSLFRIVTPLLTLHDIPMIVVNHVYQCGTKEMLVATPNGAVSIADIKKGDTVLTTNGYEEVQWTTDHEDAFITDIELEDGTVLSFTSGHRFKVDGKWKFVEDLQPGDELDAIS